MSKIFRLIIISLLASVVACVSTQSNITASGDEDQDIGLGGTGLLANSGSGMGGTGVVGVITGFGSVFVNGIEIEYNQNTPFTIDGEKASYQELSIGDVVEVLTTDIKNHTNAQIINLRHEVIGKVESVNKVESSFIVHGQTIILQDKSLPGVGKNISVAGFRIDNNTIEATRIKQVNTNQTLLRTGSELPFNKRAVRWRVQTNVRDGKAIYNIDGKPHVYSFKHKAGSKNQLRSGIRVLELKRSSSNVPELKREIDARDLPRGSKLSNTMYKNQNRMKQRSVPLQHKMHRGGH